MDEAALVAFLFEASRRGYAAGGDVAKIREVDSSTTIVYARGDWTFHDNYFGGEPYGGREVVFLDSPASEGLSSQHCPIFAGAPRLRATV